MIRRIAVLSMCALFVCGLAIAPAAAQTAPAPAYSNHDGRASGDRDKDHNNHLRDIIEGPHVEGHIAFLHAELRITPAQESLWAPVATAMRADVQDTRSIREEAANQQEPENAITYLQDRVAFAKARAAGEERFLNAFKPLYGNRSPDQKKMADELLIPPYQPD